MVVLQQDFSYNKDISPRRRTTPLLARGLGFFLRKNKEDLDAICGLVSRAIKNMIQNHIYQWDELYPTREDFQADIEKGELTVGQADWRMGRFYLFEKIL